jgi:hypothetical protein
MSKFPAIRVVTAANGELAIVMSNILLKSSIMVIWIGLK